MIKKICKTERSWRKENEKKSWREVIIYNNKTELIRKFR